MIFWILASAIGLVAALAMAWPLLSQENARKLAKEARREELEKAEAKERELELAKELASAEGARVTVFRRMLIVAGLATAFAIGPGNHRFQCQSRKTLERNRQSQED